MRTLLAWLFCFAILLSGGAGGAAHAMEPAATVPVAASAFGHVAGDADEVPADVDRASPHHHAACHDHQVGLPGLETPALGSWRVGQTLVAFRAEPRADAPPEAHPRPPRG